MLKLLYYRNYCTDSNKTLQTDNWQHCRLPISDIWTVFASSHGCGIIK